jgi:hypothetical protein
MTTTLVGPLVDAGSHICRHAERGRPTNEVLSAMWRNEHH